MGVVAGGIKDRVRPPGVVVSEFPPVLVSGDMVLPTAEVHVELPSTRCRYSALRLEAGPNEIAMRHDVQLIMPPRMWRSDGQQENKLITW